MRSSTKVLRGACVKRLVFNPALNCSQLMDDERRFGESAFQTVGAATWKLYWPSCVLPNKDLLDQKCRQLGCRRCWSMQDSAYGHSQTQKLLPWTLELYSLHHWKPVKHMAKSRRDVFISANTNDQMGSSVQNNLKSTDDLWRDTVQCVLLVLCITFEGSATVRKLF